MAQYLTIEWDHRGARLVAAADRGGRLTVSHAMAVDLPQPVDDTAAAEGTIGAAIRQALLKHRIASRWLQAIVVVPRSGVELRLLNLPPAADKDLPKIVQAAAPRELSSLADHAVIDFFPLSGSADESRYAEVTAISPERIESVKTICQAAGITPTRMVLRPHASASLVRRCASPTESIYLVCNDLGDNAELAVVADDKIVLSRNVRLQSEEEQSDRDTRLIHEIRRTVMAAQNQPLGGVVETVFLFGPTGADHPLAERIERELLPVRVIDPFSACRLRSRLAKSLPEDSGRYAALLGTILDESEGALPAIDYLNPRRAAETAANRRPWIIAATAATVVLALWLMSWRQIAAVDRQIETLRSESKELEKAVRRAVETQRAVDAIDTWTAGDVVWLDELRDLSLRFPSARDAVLLRLTMARSSAGGGAMELNGLVRDPSIVGRFERELRDAHHEVRSGRVEATVREQSYTWQFESSILVAKRPKADYLASEAEEPQPVQTDADAPARAERETANGAAEDLTRGAALRTTEEP